MTEPPQFPRYADGPEDGENSQHAQQQPGQHGQPYAGGPPPYGYPAEYGHGYPEVRNSEPNSLALAAMVSSLMGIGPLALGLGIAALRVLPRTGERGTWMAWTGVVLGGLETLVFVLFLALIPLAAWYAGGATGSVGGL